MGRADAGDPGMIRLMAAGHRSDMDRTASHIKSNLGLLQGGLEWGL
jgi:hypothetical protein